MVEDVFNYWLQIVTLQEIWWAGNGNIEFDSTLIFCNGTINDRYKYGVGFVVEEYSTAKRFNTINE